MTDERPMRNMVMINREEYEGVVLDLLVAMALGAEVIQDDNGSQHLIRWKSGDQEYKLSLLPLQYSTDWAVGGPLLKSHAISLAHTETAMWGPVVTASLSGAAFGTVEAYDPDPLIAAMRAVAISYHGPMVVLSADLVAHLKHNDSRFR